MHKEGDLLMTGEFAVAVHALVYLNHKDQILSSEELAQNVCTNPARIRKVMAMLKKAGIVSTREGSEGGYRFPGDASRTTLLQVLNAVGTPVVTSAWKPGDKDMECFVASGMADALDDIYAQLNSLCCERLREITIADIDKTIFAPERIHKLKTGLTASG